MKKFIAFFEIPTVDFHRAVDFYETVFGVQLPVFECEEEKMACFTEEGETVGAIFHAPDYLPSEKGVLSLLIVKTSIRHWKKSFGKVEKS